MIWDVYQGIEDAGAKHAAEQAMSKADSYATDIAQVRRQVERPTLACQSMWELLRDRSELTEGDIAAKMMEIDCRVGRVDGKMATQFTTCEACGKPSNSRRDSCVMCGALFRKEHQFSS